MPHYSKQPGDDAALTAFLVFLFCLLFAVLVLIVSRH
jgi:hypothetical protein